MAAPKVITGEVKFVNDRGSNGGFKVGDTWCNYPDPWHGPRCGVGDTIRVEIKGTANRVEGLTILTGGPTVPEYPDDPDPIPDTEGPVYIAGRSLDAGLRAQVLMATAEVTSECDPGRVIEEAEEYLKWVTAGIQ